MSDQCIAEHTSFTADQWAALWQKEAEARNILFNKYKSMRNKVKKSLELLDGLEDHLNGNHGCFLQAAIYELETIINE
jgi:hypothetical protein